MSCARTAMVLHLDLAQKLTDHHRPPDLPQLAVQWKRKYRLLQCSPRALSTSLSRMLETETKAKAKAETKTQQGCFRRLMHW